MRTVSRRYSCVTRSNRKVCEGSNGRGVCIFYFCPRACVEALPSFEAGIEDSSNPPKVKNNLPTALAEKDPVVGARTLDVRVVVDVSVVIGDKYIVKKQGNLP